MRRGFLIVVASVAFFSFPAAQGAEKSFSEIHAEKNATCTADRCPVGSQVIVSIDPQDILFGCDTQAKTAYTNTVAGMVGFIYQSTGKLPNVSPETGEPEVTGQSKVFLDTLRKEAGVRTLDEAAKSCLTEEDLNKKKFTILNIKHESDYAMLALNDNQLWLPLTTIKPVAKGKK